MSRRLGWLLALLPLVGCGTGEEEEPPPPAFEHAPVMQEALARLEAEVAADAPPALAEEELDPERIPGLVHMLAVTTGRERELPLEEVVGIGDPAVPALHELALDPDVAEPERIAACELLAAVGTGSAAERLAEVMETAPEAWLRAQAAWRLGEVGRDEVVPSLLLRLKYETDPAVRIWIATALGAYRNYAGLQALWTIESTGPTEELRASAAQQRWALAREVGIDDPSAHYYLWYEGDPEGRLPAPEPSTRLRLEAWRKISEISGEHFQLRGVDDARIVLSQLGAWATGPLTRALHDEDVYVRVHAAQCLERMGPRGVAAGPELLAALADPTLAPQAAAALAGIGYAPAEPALRQRLSADWPYELRVACADALGRLGIQESVPYLRAVVDRAEPLDLRQAAAEALVRFDAGEAAAPLLVEWMETPEADRFGAEGALEEWLRQREGEDAQALLEAWLELAPEPDVIPTPAEADARLAARAALVREWRPPLWQE